MKMSNEHKHLITQTKPQYKYISVVKHSYLIYNLKMIKESHNQRQHFKQRLLFIDIFFVRFVFFIRGIRHIRVILLSKPSKEFSL